MYFQDEVIAYVQCKLYTFLFSTRFIFRPFIINGEYVHPGHPKHRHAKAIVENVFAHVYNVLDAIQDNFGLA